MSQPSAEDMKKALQSTVDYLYKIDGQLGCYVERNQVAILPGSSVE